MSHSTVTVKVSRKQTQVLVDANVVDLFKDLYSKHGLVLVSGRLHFQKHRSVLLALYGDDLLYSKQIGSPFDLRLSNFIRAGSRPSDHVTHVGIVSSEMEQLLVENVRLRMEINRLKSGLALLLNQ